MSVSVLYVLTAVLAMAAMGGVAFAFVGNTGGTSKKRLASASRGAASAAAAAGSRNALDANAARRKNVQGLLKELEKQQQANKQRLSLRRRLEQAGLSITPRTYWIISAGIAAAIVLVCLVTHQPLIATVLIAPGVALGFPRWTIGFLKGRRERAFTTNFANAIDVIVRSVKAGLPTNEALKIVAREIPNPVGSEFSKLCESLKVGITLEQALKKMFDAMPTPEVSFFAIVMTIQQKSGGNLSEALGNLSNVLRDRKRLQGKIRAMSSEAKASAAIIGSLPPAVMFIVYLSTPSYIMLLFTERMGNIMLLCCAAWMTVGILVMKKMISFKH